jgi:hypothetical protein
VQPSGPQHPKRRANPNEPFICVGDKQLKEVQKAAWNAGWWPVRKRSGIMWLAPDEVGQVMPHGTASDHRAHRNAVAHPRRRFGHLTGAMHRAFAAKA